MDKMLRKLIICSNGKAISKDETLDLTKEELEKF